MDKETKELKQELIFQFSKKIKNTKDIFKEFLTYVYITFENKINLTKHILIKNKYIKIRKSILQYFVANEKSITSEILRSRIKR